MNAPADEPLLRTLADIRALLPAAYHRTFDAEWKAVDLGDLVAVARLRADWLRLATLLPDSEQVAELKAFIGTVRAARHAGGQAILDRILGPMPRERSGEDDLRGFLMDDPDGLSI